MGSRAARQLLGLAGSGVPCHLHSHLAPQPHAHPQEVVGGWSGYSLERQQEVLGAALAVASKGDWAQLEGQLRLALDLTAEG